MNGVARGSIRPILADHPDSWPAGRGYSPGSSAATEGDRSRSPVVCTRGRARRCAARPLALRLVDHGGQGGDEAGAGPDAPAHETLPSDNRSGHRTQGGGHPQQPVVDRRPGHHPIDPRLVSGRPERPVAAHRPGRRVRVRTGPGRPRPGAPSRAQRAVRPVGARRPGPGRRRRPRRIRRRRHVARCPGTPRSASRIRRGRAPPPGPPGRW